MIGVVQSRAGKRGTCFRVALASILELGEQDVPDFGGDEPGEQTYWRRVDKWLASRGLQYEQVPIVAGAPAPVGWHTIEGISPRGGNHAVVGYNGRFVHDPHPTWDDPRRGLVEPRVWGLLVPIAQQRGIDALSGKRINRSRLHRALDWVLNHRRVYDDAEFSESDHPRDDSGKFAKSGGGGSNTRGHAVRASVYSAGSMASREAYIEKELKCSPRAAKKYARSVAVYSGSGYFAVRSGEDRHTAAVLQNYVEAAPKWDGNGPLYRGVGLRTSQRWCLKSALLGQNQPMGELLASHAR